MGDFVVGESRAGGLRAHVAHARSPHAPSGRRRGRRRSAAPICFRAITTVYARAPPPAAAAANAPGGRALGAEAHRTLARLQGTFSTLCGASPGPLGVTCRLSVIASPAAGSRGALLSERARHSLSIWRGSRLAQQRERCAQQRERHKRVVVCPFCVHPDGDKYGPAKRSRDSHQEK